MHDKNTSDRELYYCQSRCSAKLISQIVTYKLGQTIRSWTYLLYHFYNNQSVRNTTKDNEKFENKTQSNDKKFCRILCILNSQADINYTTASKPKRPCVFEEKNTIFGKKKFHNKVSSEASESNISIIGSLAD